MNSNHSSLQKLQDPNIDADKLSYEIFSILESKFLFGYDDQKLTKPKHVSPDVALTTPTTAINNDAAQSIKNQRGKICVLSIDGGGMRSILAGKALAYLENALKVKSGNSDARIADYFDVAAGTGVGGVFTAMLFATKNQSCPVFQADDTWRFLAAEGQRLYSKTSTSGGGGGGGDGGVSGGGGGGGGLFKRIFGGGGGSRVSRVSRATTGFENAMKEAFTVNGRGLTLKDTLKPILIPCYDLSSSAPFLFSRADALENDSFDFRLWEVCRATSAAPGVFEPVSMRSTDGKTRCVAVDGGLSMSNPTAAAITHVLHNKQEFPFVRGVEDLLVLSLGSGQFLEGNYNYDQVKGWKASQWCRPVARISGEASADMVDHAVALAFGQSRSSNYIRIQANGSNFGGGGINVDSDPSPSNVRMLTAMADEMLKQKNVESVLFEGKRVIDQTNLEKLDYIAGELVLEHQRRSCRIAPTVVLKPSANPTKPPM